MLDIYCRDNGEALGNWGKAGSIRPIFIQFLFWELFTVLSSDLMEVYLFSLILVYKRMCKIYSLCLNTLLWMQKKRYPGFSYLFPISPVSLNLLIWHAYWNMLCGELTCQWLVSWSSNFWKEGSLFFLIIFFFHHPASWSYFPESL